MTPMPGSPTDLSDAERNAERRLRLLVAEARRNEATLQRFQSLELSLMSSKSLADLFASLLHEARTRLSWDVVSLLLHDPQGEIAKLLQLDKNCDFDNLHFYTDINALRSLYGTVHKPHLGRFEIRRHNALFPDHPARPASVGLLPLTRAGHLLGSYNLGSPNPDRFTGGVATDFLEHLAAVIALCLEMIVARENLKVLGLTDPLTGINNRRFFDQRIREEAARALRDNAYLSCLMIDVDHFKVVNDTHGHPFGDHVLQNVAELIRTQLRQIDVVARFGGEEFAVVLGAADVTKATEIAERIRSTVEQKTYDLPSGGTAKITLSIGIATLHPHTGEQATELAATVVTAADAALYQAKISGRNRVCSG